MNLTRRDIRVYFKESLYVGRQIQLICCLDSLLSSGCCDVAADAISGSHFTGFRLKVG